MSAVPRKRLTVCEYLAIEERAEFKSEFFRGEMFAMAGAAEPHNRVKENIVVEVGTQLKGGPCRSYSSDQRVLVEATGLYTYPDILVVCGPGEFDTVDKHALTNPRVIMEVLSRSTEAYDRGDKFRNYQEIPTLQEYILVHQDEAVCERFVRHTDGSWGQAVAFAGQDARLKFTSIPVDVALADIYAGVAMRPGDPQSPG